MNPLIRVHTWIFVFFPHRNFPSELEDADRNAPRPAIFSGYMDSIFQAKAPPFSDPRSQGSHHWDCPPFFLPHLFYFSHQIHRSSALSSGYLYYQSINCFSICFSLSGALIWLGIVVSLFSFRSFMIRCLYVSRWGNRWSSKILMELSPLLFLMLITALVFFPSHPFVWIKLFKRF